MIKVDELPVNILNPRYVPQDSEINEINMIMSNSSFEKLLKDIALYGIDPSENLLVSKDDDGGYIVEEGNRRLTAIKLLNNPEIVPVFVKNRDKYIKKYEKIIKSSNYKIITEIHCALIEDEMTVKHFVQLKHTGENGGAGRVRWDTESKIRFSDSNEFRRYLLDFVQSLIPERNEKYNITTIERIIGDPQMRDYFSMEINRKEPLISFVSEKGKEKFSKVIRDLGNGIYNVTDLKRKEDRFKFIQKLKDEEIISSPVDTIFNVSREEIVAPDVPREEIVAPDVPREEIVAPDVPREGIVAPDVPREGIVALDVPREEIAAPGVSREEIAFLEETRTEKVVQDEMKFDTEAGEIRPPGNEIGVVGTKRTRRQTEPKERKYPFQGINYKGNTPGISFALHELHNIPEIYNYPLAATTLFRTFFECTIQEFIQKSGVQIMVKDNKSIKDLSIDSLLQTCCNNGNGNLKNLQKHNQLLSRIMSEANSKRDQDELNVVTHGNYRIASKNALMDMERRWFEAIKIMITEISD